MSIEQHFTIQELADKLSVHPRTVMRWIAAGKITPVELPGAETGKRHMVRIPASEVEKLGVKVTVDSEESD